MISFDFEINLVDNCIYYKFYESKYIFLILYVDDILLVNNDIGLLHEIKIFLIKNFEMKDFDNACFVLSIHIHRDRSRNVLKLSQKSYIKKIFKKYSIQNYKSGDTLVIKGDKFNLNQRIKNAFEEKNVKDSLCISSMESNVCSDMYASEYYVYY